MIDRMRRYVTGHNDDGKSIYVHAEEVPKTEAALYPSATYWLAWGTDDGIPAVGENLPGVHKPFFGQAGSTRFIAVRFAPNTAAGAGAGSQTSPAELEAMRQDAEEKFPGLFDLHAAEGDDAAFHTTDSVDYGFVVEGEIDLVLDDGRTETLRPGSFVVQRGTRHAWINRSDKPALCVYVLIGAQRSAG